jgi:hypothetical protein
MAPPDALSRLVRHGGMDEQGIDVCDLTRLGERPSKRLTGMGGKEQQRFSEISREGIEFVEADQKLLRRPESVGLSYCRRSSDRH